MKTNVLKACPALLPALAAALLAVSCNLSVSEEKCGGTIAVHFCETDDLLTKSEPFRLDTNSFILNVSDSKGAVIYSGSFGAAPSRIMVSEGTYTVSIVSGEFTTPLFDAPQYGDTRVVAVKSGEDCSVILECAQLNSGVRLKIDPAFLTVFPDAVMYLKSPDGKLMYGYAEKRVAYFKPGKVSLVMNRSGAETTVCSRTLESRQILTLNVEVSGGGTGLDAGIHVKVDTSRLWTSENVLIGGGGSDRGDDISNAYSVSQAKNHIGAVDVWVYGYIVGGDLSSSKCSFNAPFNSRTNLVIAEKSSCTDKEDCLSVQLPQGILRDALNLVDHPDNIGRVVKLKGDIVQAYYGIPGIQSISEYSF